MRDAPIPDLPPNRTSVRRIGGADRDRTGDPLLAKQVLSQLSYGPWEFSTEPEEHVGGPERVVGLGRFELPTSRLSGVRSNQLSYRPPEHPSQANADPKATLAGTDARTSCLTYYH